MRKINFKGFVKVLFKDTLVLNGGYMSGPVSAPLLFAIPLIILYAFVVIPIYSIFLLIEIIKKVKNKQKIDKLEILGHFLLVIIFSLWIIWTTRYFN